MTLEDDIKNKLTFRKVTSSGYHTLCCPVCNDTQYKAGFRFDSDKIIYNCFKGKCSASCEYVFGEYMSGTFRKLMSTIDVEIPLDTKLKNKKLKKTVLSPDLYTQHSYTELNFPEDFVSYGKKYWWFDELMEDRNVDFRRKLYVGKEGNWKNKLIVPCYYNNVLIGWQGINHYNNKTFYLTSSDNSDIMYINNTNGRIVKNPIVVEGIMDAAVIPNAIATFGNKVSKKQAYMLRNSTPILLPDRTGSGFLDIAKKYNWKISIPQWKEKDVNDAVKRHGVFVVAKMIHDGVQDNMLKAKVAYNLWKGK